MRFKKGEITSQQIVILIIVIASFAVLLFFLFRLDLGKTTDVELCHNSVLTRGSSIAPTEAIPLQCHRQYVCLTAKGGTCEGLTNPERIEVSTLNETYKALADQMANCWWMFGEGKVNYVGGDFFQHNYCSICSQIYFDKSLKGITGDIINKDNLYKYMEKTKIDDTNTYTDYIFGGRSLDSLKQEVLDKEGVGTFGNIELGKQYFVITGIVSETDWKYWTAGAGSALTGGKLIGAALVKFTPLLTTNPVGWIAGAVIIGGAAGGALIADSINPEIAVVTLDGRGVDNKFLAPAILEASPERFDELNCKDVLTLA